MRVSMRVAAEHDMICTQVHAGFSTPEAASFFDKMDDDGSDEIDEAEFCEGGSPMLAYMFRNEVSIYALSLSRPALLPLPLSLAWRRALLLRFVASLLPNSISTHPGARREQLWRRATSRTQRTCARS